MSSSKRLKKTVKSMLPKDLKDIDTIAKKMLSEVKADLETGISIIKNENALPISPLGTNSARIIRITNIPLPTNPPFNQAFIKQIT